MTVPRATALAASVLLVAWALCVPFLHGHLATGVAHVHGEPQVASTTAGPAHETSDADHEVGDGHGSARFGETPLPLATGGAAFVLAVAVAVAVARPSSGGGAAERATVVAWPARGSPVARFEVVRV